MQIAERTIERMQNCVMSEKFLSFVKFQLHFGHTGNLVIALGVSADAWTRVSMVEQHSTHVSNTGRLRQSMAFSHMYIVFHRLRFCLPFTCRVVFDSANGRRPIPLGKLSGVKHERFLSHPKGWILTFSLQSGAMSSNLLTGTIPQAFITANYQIYSGDTMQKTLFIIEELWLYMPPNTCC